MPDVDLTTSTPNASASVRRTSHPRKSRPASRLAGCTTSPLVCSDVEATIRFYQDLLEFPLTEIFENRDYQGSNHFFFDIGNGNLLAFFDFPGLDLGPYAEVLGGLHHVAISVAPDRWDAPAGRSSTTPGVEYVARVGQLDLLHATRRRPRWS